MNNSERVTKSCAPSSRPQSLISFMEQSREHWCIKDNRSRFIYMNKSLMDALNTPKNFDVEGRLDKEIPVKPCQELWPEFVEHDKRVINKNKRISSIAIHYYGKGNVNNPNPHFCEKMPLYDQEGKTIGIVCYGRIIDSSALLYYMRRLDRKTMQFDAPNDVFTKGELDVIFWAQQRLTAKEIAKRLNIAPRTVENRLQFVYEKAGVHSIIQLVEYCRDTGLDTYVPADFIRNGFQFIE